MLFWLPVRAQQSQVWHDENRVYKDAIELFSKKQFAASLELFRRVKEDPSGTDELIRANAAFYEALCALELINDNADELMIRYIREFPENSFVNRGRFELARFYYRKKKFRDAIAWFNLTEERNLNSEEKAEYIFKKGYSAFMLEDLAEAERNFFLLKDETTSFSPAASYYYAHISYTKGNYETALKEFLELESDDVFGPVVPYYIVQIYFLQGKNEQVVKYGPSLLDSSESKRAPELARIIAESYFNLERYDESIPYYQRFVKERTPGPADHYQIAYAYYKAGRCEEAIPYFQLLSSDEEFGQTSLYNLGKCYLESGRKEYARSAFAAAAKPHGNPVLEEDAGYHYALLAYELSSHPYSDAVHAINQYLLQFPDSPRKDKVNSLLVNAFMTTRNYKEALASLDRIREKSPALVRIYQEVLFNRGVQLFNAGNYGSASEHFTRAMQNGTNPILSAKSLFWKADAAYRTKNYTAAAELFADFLDAPVAGSLGNYFDAHYNLGYVYYKQKQYPRAITSFRNYAQINPSPDKKKQTDAFLRTGDAFFILKDFPGAADFYGRAAGGNLQTDYALFQQALAYGLSGRNDEKIRVMNQLIKNHPASSYYADALFESGRTYQILGKPQEAVNMFDQVMQLKDHRLAARAGVQKGLVYFNLGEDEKALAQWKGVVDKYPGTEEAYAAINQIRNLMVNTGRGSEFATYVQAVPFGNFSAAALDSVSYESGERLYMAGDCSKAIPAFSEYLQKFPQGIFSVNAHYYRGECYWKDKNYQAALADFKFVTDGAPGSFSERALVKAGNILFFNKDFARAINVYSRLEKESTQPQYRQESLIGLMRSYFRLNDTLKASAYAVQVHALEKLSTEVEDEANLIRGLGEMVNGNTDNAFLILNRLAETRGSANAAAARFHAIDILYQQGKLDEAEKAVFKMAEKFSAYEFWLAKAFIRLSDIYVSKGDFFQAKATLESIIDNYSGDDLKLIATQKLEAVIQMENAAKADLPEQGNVVPEVPDPVKGEGEE